jgi:hypothetical protein
MPSLDDFNVSLKPNTTVVLTLAGIAVVWLLYAINSRQRETAAEIRDLRLGLARERHERTSERTPAHARGENNRPSPDVDATVVSVEDDDEGEEDSESGPEQSDETEDVSDADVPTPQPAESEGN